MKKLEKIKTKWNDYNTAADAAGIDLDVFCNKTCSDSCFTNVNSTTESVQTILTQCLIKTCHCFKPKLPEVEAKVESSRNSLLEFSKIVAEVEAEEAASELLGGDAKDVAKAAA